MEQATTKIISGTVGFNRRLKSLFAVRETGIFLALLIICTLLTLTTSNFLTVQNLLNIGRQVSLLGIMAIGMTFVLISREVDLSIGSIYAAGGLSTGLLLGPGGEFAFVIVAAAISEGLLAPNIASVVLFVTALTMATIPLLSRLGERLAPHLAPTTPVDPRILVPEFSDAPARVILAGFGRVGQMVAAMLDVHGVPYVAIDRDPTGWRANGRAARRSITAT